MGPEVHTAANPLFLAAKYGERDNGKLETVTCFLHLPEGQAAPASVAHGRSAQEESRGEE